MGEQGATMSLAELRARKAAAGRPPARGGASTTRPGSSAATSRGAPSSSSAARGAPRTVSSLREKQDRASAQRQSVAQEKQRRLAESRAKDEQRRAAAEERKKRLEEDQAKRRQQAVLGARGRSGIPVRTTQPASKRAAPTSAGRQGVAASGTSRSTVAPPSQLPSRLAMSLPLPGSRIPRSPSGSKLADTGSHSGPTSPMTDGATRGSRIPRPTLNTVHSSPRSPMEMSSSQSPDGGVFPDSAWSSVMTQGNLRRPAASSAKSSATKVKQKQRAELEAELEALRRKEKEEQLRFEEEERRLMEDEPLDGDEVMLSPEDISKSDAVEEDEEVQREQEEQAWLDMKRQEEEEELARNEAKREEEKRLIEAELERRAEEKRTEEARRQEIEKKEREEEERRRRLKEEEEERLRKEEREREEERWRKEKEEEQARRAKEDEERRKREEERRKEEEARRREEEERRLEEEMRKEREEEQRRAEEQERQKRLEEEVRKQREEEERAARRQRIRQIQERTNRSVAGVTPSTTLSSLKAAGSNDSSKSETVGQHTSSFEADATVTKDEGGTQEELNSSALDTTRRDSITGEDVDETNQTPGVFESSPPTQHAETGVTLDMSNRHDMASVSSAGSDSAQQSSTLDEDSVVERIMHQPSLVDEWHNIDTDTSVEDLRTELMEADVPTSSEVSEHELERSSGSQRWGNRRVTSDLAKIGAHSPKAAPTRTTSDASFLQGRMFALPSSFTNLSRSRSSAGQHQRSGSELSETSESTSPVTKSRRPHAWSARSADAPLKESTTAPALEESSVTSQRHDGDAQESSENADGPPPLPSSPPPPVSTSEKVPTGDGRLNDSDSPPPLPVSPPPETEDDIEEQPTASPQAKIGASEISSMSDKRNISESKLFQPPTAQHDDRDLGECSAEDSTSVETEATVRKTSGGSRPAAFEQKLPQPSQMPVKSPPRFPGAMRVLPTVGMQPLSSSARRSTTEERSIASTTSEKSTPSKEARSPGEIESKQWSYTAGQPSKDTKSPTRVLPRLPQSPAKAEPELQTHKAEELSLEPDEHAHTITAELTSSHSDVSRHQQASIEANRYQRTSTDANRHQRASTDVITTEESLWRSLEAIPYHGSRRKTSANEEALWRRVESCDPTAHTLPVAEIGSQHNELVDIGSEEDLDTDDLDTDDDGLV